MRAQKQRIASVHELAKNIGTKIAPVRIAVAGAGGTGSQMISRLARMDYALRSLEITSLIVDLYDPDRVSQSNVGRQLFTPSEVGLYKSDALIHRANQQFCLRWISVPEAYSDQTCKQSVTSGGVSRAIRPDTALGAIYSISAHGAGAPLVPMPYDILITCVDSTRARVAINDALFASPLRPTYWMDCGNDKDYGQVILGQLGGKGNPSCSKLPTVIERYPEAFGEDVEETNTPSCSLAEALEGQDLFVNDHVASWGAKMLWELLKTRKLKHCGYFISLKDGRVSPIAVSRDNG